MESIKDMLSQKKYAALVFALAGAFFYIIIWLQNLPSLRSVFGVLPDVGSKIQFLFSLITTVGTNFTTISFITTLTLSLLLGLNITLVIFYINQRKTSDMHIVFGKGLAGFIAGVFGVGCSACGAALIGPLFALFGIGGILTVLPLHGQEFTLVGIIILIFSIRSLIRKMQIMVCESDFS